MKFFLRNNQPFQTISGDDLVSEAAVAGGCDFVVSFHERPLRAAREFGNKVIKPVELLRLIGKIK